MSWTWERLQFLYDANGRRFANVVEFSRKALERTVALGICTDRNSKAEFRMRERRALRHLVRAVTSDSMLIQRALASTPDQDDLPLEVEDAAFRAFLWCQRLTRDAMRTIADETRSHLDELAKTVLVPAWVDGYQARTDLINASLDRDSVVSAIHDFCSNCTAWLHLDETANGKAWAPDRVEALLEIPRIAHTGRMRAGRVPLVPLLRAKVLGLLERTCGGDDDPEFIDFARSWLVDARDYGRDDLNWFVDIGRRCIDVLRDQPLAGPTSDDLSVEQMESAMLESVREYRSLAHPSDDPNEDTAATTTTLEDSLVILGGDVELNIFARLASDATMILVSAFVSETRNREDPADGGDNDDERSDLVSLVQTDAQRVGMTALGMLVRRLKRAGSLYHDPTEDMVDPRVTPDLSQWTGNPLDLLYVFDADASADPWRERAKEAQRSAYVAQRHLVLDPAFPRRSLHADTRREVLALTEALETQHAILQEMADAATVVESRPSVQLYGRDPDLRPESFAFLFTEYAVAGIVDSMSRAALMQQPSLPPAPPARRRKKARTRPDFGATGPRPPDVPPVPLRSARATINAMVFNAEMQSDLVYLGLVDKSGIGTVLTSTLFVEKSMAPNDIGDYDDITRLLVYLRERQNQSKLRRFLDRVVESRVSTNIELGESNAYESKLEQIKLFVEYTPGPPEGRGLGDIFAALRGAVDEVRRNDPFGSAFFVPFDSNDKGKVRLSETPATVHVGIALLLFRATLGLAEASASADARQDFLYDVAQPGANKTAALRNLFSHVREQPVLMLVRDAFFEFARRRETYVGECLSTRHQLYNLSRAAHTALPNVLSRSTPYVTLGNRSRASSWWRKKDLYMFAMSAAGPRNAIGQLMSGLIGPLSTAIRTTFGLTTLPFYLDWIAMTTDRPREAYRRFMGQLDAPYKLTGNLEQIKAAVNASTGAEKAQPIIVAENATLTPDQSAAQQQAENRTDSSAPVANQTQVAVVQQIPNANDTAVVVLQQVEVNNTTDTSQTQIALPTQQQNGQTISQALEATVEALSSFVYGGWSVVKKGAEASKSAMEEGLAVLNNAMPVDTSSSTAKASADPLLSASLQAPGTPSRCFRTSSVHDGIVTTMVLADFGPASNALGSQIAGESLRNYMVDVFSLNFTQSKIPTLPRVKALFDVFFDQVVDTRVAKSYSNFVGEDRIVFRPTGDNWAWGTQGAQSDFYRILASAMTPEILNETMPAVVADFYENMVILGIDNSALEAQGYAMRESLIRTAGIEVPYWDSTSLEDAKTRMDVKSNIAKLRTVPRTPLTLTTEKSNESPRLAQYAKEASKAREDLFLATASLLNPRLGANALSFAVSSLTSPRSPLLPIFETPTAQEVLSMMLNGGSSLGTMLSRRAVGAALHFALLPGAAQGPRNNDEPIQRSQNAVDDLVQFGADASLVPRIPTTSLIRSHAGSLVGCVVFGAEAAALNEVMMATVSWVNPTALGLWTSLFFVTCLFFVLNSLLVNIVDTVLPPSPLAAPETNAFNRINDYITRPRVTGDTDNLVDTLAKAMKRKSANR